MKNTLHTLVAGTGLVVCIGWLAGVDSLTRVIPGAVTMKFVTAMSFILAGIGGLGHRQETTGQMIYRHGMAMVLFCLQVAILLIGPPVLFENEQAIHSAKPGEPSMMTVVGFMLCSFVMWAMPNASVSRIGLGLIFIGAVAVVGHVTSWHSLQWYIPGESSAMAIHTAIGFVCLGVSYRRAARQYISCERINPQWDS